MQELYELRKLIDCVQDSYDEITEQWEKIGKRMAN